VAPRPHPSKHGSKSAVTQPVTSSKDVRRRHRGQRPAATENPIRNNDPGGHAATVAGYAGPGFLTWPSGHIPQNTDPNPLLRSRSPPQKTFGAATGVSDPRLQKTRIRSHFAGGSGQRENAIKRLSASR
jgi:hypothetical protein